MQVILAESDCPAVGHAFVPAAGFENFDVFAQRHGIAMAGRSCEMETL